MGALLNFIFLRYYVKKKYILLNIIFKLLFLFNILSNLLNKGFQLFFLYFICKKK